MWSRDATADDVEAVRRLCAQLGYQLSTEETAAEIAWPPRSLFTLPREDPRIGRMEISGLALSTGIFGLHGGSLTMQESSGKVTFVSRLPA